MKYRDILGFSKPKKKVIKEQSKPKKNKIIENVKQELNEWYHQPPSEKRWSKNTTDTGLTEFEQRGGKDFIKEVGSAAEYRPYIKKIEKSQHQYEKDLDKFFKFADKKLGRGNSTIKEMKRQYENYFTRWIVRFKTLVRNLL